MKSLRCIVDALRNSNGKSHQLFPFYISHRSSSLNSHDWLERQRKDPYVKKAKYVSYRARSAFKLVELDDKYHILKRGQIVVDVGAAPGSWCQVAVSKVNPLITDTAASSPTTAYLDVKELDRNKELGDWKTEKNQRPNFNLSNSSNSSNFSNSSHFSKNGFVIGVDLLNIEPLPGAHFLSPCDFTHPKTQRRIVELLKGRQIDVLLSDMAPNSTGIGSVDHDMIIALCTSAIEFGKPLLANNGTFLCKIWAGSEQRNFLENLKTFFRSVRFVKPPASRGESAETFVLAMGYKKPEIK